MWRARRLFPRPGVQREISPLTSASAALDLRLRTDSRLPQERCLTLTLALDCWEPRPIRFTEQGLAETLYSMPRACSSTPEPIKVRRDTSPEMACGPSL